MRCSIHCFEASFNGVLEWCVTVKIGDAHEGGELTSSVWTQEFSEAEEGLVMAVDACRDYVKHGSLYAQPIGVGGWRLGGR